MRIDFIAFATNYGIDYKHRNNEWLEMLCPFCGRTYLCFNTRTCIFNCWKCGRLDSYETLGLLSGMDRQSLYKSLREYKSLSKEETFYKALPDLEKLKDIVAPSSCSYMKTQHLKYLSDRGFDTEELQSVYGLKSADELGKFKYRILIPIQYRGKTVAWQGRTTCDEVTPKYLSSSLKESSLSVKECLYGIDLCSKLDTIAIVEGVADAWKLGPGAVATFGVDYTEYQLGLMLNFRRVFVVYDNDPAGQGRAEDLCKDLSLFNIKVENIKLNEVKDAGELKLKEARELMRELGIQK